MYQLELNIRFSFAKDWFYDGNPDADIFELDEINAEVNASTEFDQLSDKARKFIEDSEYDAFKQGVTPPWFEEDVEEIDEDAPLTPQEKEMMKDWK